VPFITTLLVVVSPVGRGVPVSFVSVAVVVFCTLAVVELTSTVVLTVFISAVVVIGAGFPVVARFSGNVADASVVAAVGPITSVVTARVVPTVVVGAAGKKAGVELFPPQ